MERQPQGGGGTRHTPFAPLTRATLAQRLRFAFLLLLAPALIVVAAFGRAEAPATGQRTLLLAHYMPWFEAKPPRAQWGWHWTMNHFDPDEPKAGSPRAASHYTPLIGYYDSADDDVLECQALQMKLAGIEGVILDWYGTDDYLDYGSCHRSSLQLVEQLKKAGLRFAVCYEDQTVPRLIEGKVVEADGAVEHGKKVLRWLAEHWFRDPAYVQVGGRPLFLVYGPQYYNSEQWQQLFSALPEPPEYFSLHHRRKPARGAFDWPQPAPSLGLAAVDSFYREARDWPASIPVAFPRFHDIYREAGGGKSYGRIEDDSGKTYMRTLEQALASKATVAQIATWNDWGEGTVIEPSAEFGYRDLEATQALRRRFGAAPRASATDLRLPYRLLQLRRLRKGDAAVQRKLDEAARFLSRGEAGKARRALGSLEKRGAEAVHETPRPRHTSDPKAVRTGA